MSSSRVLAALSVVLLTGGACRKKVEVPPPPAPAPVPVRVPLQITHLDPSTAVPDTPVVARVFGGGFKPGAQVWFGDQRGSEVSVHDGNTLSVRIPALGEGRWDVTVANVDGVRATLRQALLVEAKVLACRQSTVYFGFDSNAVSEEGMALLEGHMACYQQEAGPIRIEGHADERGTIDYNLALGQRRADAITSVLQQQGVSGDRVTTVSYGEERPSEDASNEAAWAANRRAEILATE